MTRNGLEKRGCSLLGLGLGAGSDGVGRGTGPGSPPASRERWVVLGVALSRGCCNAADAAEPLETGFFS